MLPWIPLLRGAGKQGIIEQWKQVASLEKDTRLRTTYGRLALVFAELARRRVVWAKGLEKWNVYESQVMNEWRNEGRMKGMAEGRVEGRVEVKRADLLRALQLRFQQVPADLVSAVSAQSDLDKLSTWFDVALTAASPDEFRAALQR